MVALERASREKCREHHCSFQFSEVTEIQAFKVRLWVLAGMAVGTVIYRRSGRGHYRSPICSSFGRAQPSGEIVKPNFKNDVIYCAINVATLPEFRFYHILHKLSGTTPFVDFFVHFSIFRALVICIKNDYRNCGCD